MVINNTSIILSSSFYLDKDISDYTATDSTAIIGIFLNTEIMSGTFPLEWLYGYVFEPLINKCNSK